MGIGSIEQVLLKAKSFEKRGEIEEARKLYSTTLKLYPKNTRVKKALNKISTQKKLSKYSDSIPKNEIDYCESKGLNKYQHYAGRFAAKEAVFKVLNGEIVSERSLAFKDIEILNANDGAPYINILDDIMIDCFDMNLDISISHIKKYATATAISVNPPFRP